MSAATPLLRAIVVDDDPFSRAQVEIELREHRHAITLIAQCTNAEEGILAIQRERPDLLFLDVRMPGMDGFAMLDAIKQRDFGVVFITRFDQYAIRAFRYSALDYLLKPIKREEFNAAIAHALAYRDRSSTRLGHLLNERRSQQSVPGTLVIVTRHGDRHLSTAEIMHCVADRTYTWFHLRSGEKLLSSYPMSTYEEFLSEKDFLRVHRSHMVNVAHITSLSDQGVITLNNGVAVEISRRRKAEIVAALERK